MMCMASGGKAIREVKNIGRVYVLVQRRGATLPDGWAYRFMKINTIILYYWSAGLCDLQHLNIRDPRTLVAVHLDRPPAFMRRFLHHFDVLILNTGHHWNRRKLNANGWAMYVGGKPNEDRKRAEMGNPKNFTILRWLDSQFPSHPRLTAFFRTISTKAFLQLGIGTLEESVIIPSHYLEEVMLYKMVLVIQLLRRH